MSNILGYKNSNQDSVDFVVNNIFEIINISIDFLSPFCQRATLILSTPNAEVTRVLIKDDTLAKLGFKIFVMKKEKDLHVVYKMCLLSQSIVLSMDDMSFLENYYNFLLYFLDFIHLTDVYYLFKLMLQYDIKINSYIQIKLVKFGLVDILKELILKNIQMIRKKENIKDKTKGVLSLRSLFSLIYTMLKNPVISEFVDVKSILNILKDEYIDFPDDILNGKWEIISQLTQCENYEVLSSFQDEAMKLLFKENPYLKRYQVYVIHYFSALVPVYNEFGTNAVIDRIFNLFLQYKENSILNQSIRIYLNSAIYNNEVGPYLLEKFLPLLTSEIKKDSHTLLTASSYRIIITLIDSNLPFVNDFFSNTQDYEEIQSLVKLYLDTSIQEYGGIT